VLKLIVVPAEQQNIFSDLTTPEDSDNTSKNSGDNSKADPQPTSPESALLSASSPRKRQLSV
jgi:hypothetical protein